MYDTIAASKTSPFIVQLHKRKLREAATGYGGLNFGRRNARKEKLAVAAWSVRISRQEISAKDIHAAVPND